MSLNTLACKAPIPHEPERGAEAAALFGRAPENVSALIAGVAGCSPYLRGLIGREAEWLANVLDTDPDQVLADILAAVRRDSIDILGRDLRQAKRRLALYTALADCGGVWPLGKVTNALTDLADFAVQATLDALLAAELARGKLPGCTEADLATACGMVVLAMGKMGAGELNYSSDIDLIVLFDEARHAERDFDDIRERFIRVTRRMAKILSDVTGDGYVFRTDLRLRPDPSVTPVCLSMGAAERYYESVGRTWERAAYIKARPCAGDLAAGWAFLDTLRPFVWRKHLDYAAIQDAHDMRLRIREHKGLGGRITLPGHNMKLGRGGIREIEFFTQTRQIIAGGRDPDLRSRETLAGLDMLAAKGWISPLVAETLAAAYIAHRTTEHRIQMLADAQTHDLPGAGDPMLRLAHFCGFPTLAAFQGDLIPRLEKVHELTESFFAPEAGAASEDMPDITPAMRSTIDKWRSLPALRTARANEIFRRLLPVILKQVLKTANPEETLNQFDGFLGGLPAGVQLFSLFEANPQLVELLVDICGSAPSLARYLSRNAQVFDGVIGGTFFQPLPSAGDMAQDLAARLDGIDDYETQLNTLRRWMKELHFRIGVLHLKGMIGSEQAGRHYADLAGAVLRALLRPVAAEFSRRHGAPPGRGAMVLGMGSLGAESLTATSDLDVIVIYDADGAEKSDGKRPLPVTTYYARLTQALVTALTSQMAEGRLYEVDMRLRPSGRKGPVATPLSGFMNYQRSEAWTWEHLALTRARAIAGPRALCDAIETFRRELIAAPREAAKILTDTAEMRDRLSDAADRSRVGDIWEAKLGPGRMLDIELLAQAAALLTGSPERAVAAQLDGGIRLGWYDEAGAAMLRDAYARLSRMQQIGRLMVEGRLDPAEIGRGGCKLLLAETGAASLAELETELAGAQVQVAGMIDAILGRKPQ
ncbi:MAG: glutamine-synthetase adenylyltransferase [Rhodobacteraceae bacterium]|nr:glutamine-synthetase adenylyltransferase [Paracoccaceae bacterium]